MGDGSSGQLRQAIRFGDCHRRRLCHPDAQLPCPSSEWEHCLAEAVPVPAANGGAATKGSAPKTKEQKRAEAEARNRAYRLLKKERARLAEVELQMEADDARHAELMELMADESLYADKERFDACLAEYNELKARMPKLEAEWLELSATIETEMKRAEEGR